MKLRSPSSLWNSFLPAKATAALVAAVFLGLTANTLHAAKKGPKAGHGTPSAQLDPLLAPCLDAIAAPLNQTPKLPRVEVEKLRSSFAADQVTADTPHQRQIFQNAMAVCDALTTGMDDRTREAAAALAGGTMPTLSTGGGIVKSSPIRGRNAGANAEAIRKKQGNERNYADKDAKATAAFVESGAYKSWTDKATRLRQNVMALFTQQKQLEAFEEKEVKEERALARQQKQQETPEEKSVPAQSKSAADTADKGLPTASKQSETPDKKPPTFVGNWSKGDMRVVVRGDHTLTKTSGKGKNVDGKWTVEPDGEFQLQWGKEGRPLKARLSSDGRTLDFRIAVWTRD